MSAFLGPIHHWLYKKIQYQYDLTSHIVASYDKTLTDLKHRHTLSQEPLDSIIDGTNIHGWLQERVSEVEYQLAEAVTLILKSKPDELPALQNMFFEFGKDNKCTATGSAKEVFKFLNDTLLDGMPCDHANSVISQSDDEVLWQRTNCVHQDYWDDVDGDVSIYYALRDELIKGMLDQSAFEYLKLENNRYCLKRR